MVTHSNTSRPVQCLCMAERTGCPVLTDLWPYVLPIISLLIMLFIFTLMPNSPLVLGFEMLAVSDVLIMTTRRSAVNQFLESVT